MKLKVWVDEKAAIAQPVVYAFSILTTLQSVPMCMVFPCNKHRGACSSFSKLPHIYHRLGEYSTQHNEHHNRY